MNVVVKIQRPGIEGLITTDLRALRTVGWWLNLLPFVRRRADVPALLAEFTRILFEEMDYLAEGRNAETFAVSFANRSDVRVPRVVWTRTTRRVLTLEDVFGTKLTDHEAIVAAGIDPKDVAARLFDAYLKQIFEDGFFHADPHPGNLFVSPVGLGEGAQGWRLTFVDFGMVGRVSPSLRSGLRDTLIAVGLRDSARLVRAWQSIGVLRPGADLARLERAIGPVLDRFWGKSMEEIREMTSLEMGDLIRELRGLVAEFPFQVPQDLILLGRALGILSGMCSGLDPSFNAWPRIAPFARLLVAEDASRPWTALLDELGTGGAVDSRGSTAGREGARGRRARGPDDTGSRLDRPGGPAGDRREAVDRRDRRVRAAGRGPADRARRLPLAPRWGSWQERSSRRCGPPRRHADAEES